MLLRQQNLPNKTILIFPARNHIEKTYCFQQALNETQIKVSCDAQQYKPCLLTCLFLLLHITTMHIIIDIFTTYIQNQNAQWINIKIMVL